MGKIYKFREVARILKEHDSRFIIYENRGKGSERMIYHPDVNGRAESFPIKFHGNNDDLRPYVVPDIIKRFNLPRKLFK